MDNDGAVAEEGPNSFLGRGEQVGVDVFEGFTIVDARDLSVLAAEISDLASGWCIGVAGRILATNERVKMGKSRSAVAVLGNWVDVDVIGLEMSALSNEIKP